MLTYALEPVSYRCAVTESSRSGSQNDGDGCALHEVAVVAQNWSHGVSGQFSGCPLHWSKASGQRVPMPKTTFSGALPEPSDPARVPYSMWSRSTVRS